jgi:hypothetical protein
MQDLCVGDFWETQERRSITSFTTAIAVDRFKLVTLLRPQAAPAIFVFPEMPELSRSYSLAPTQCPASCHRRSQPHPCASSPLPPPSHSLVNVFKPFTLTVWLLHLAMMLLGAAVILFTETTGTVFNDSHVRSGGNQGKPMRFSVRCLEFLDVGKQNDSLLIFAPREALVVREHSLGR